MITKFINIFLLINFTLDFFKLLILKCGNLG